MGELTIGVYGPAFNLWEAILHHRDEQFPLFLEGQLYSRPELATSAMLALSGQGERIARMSVGERGLEQVDAIIRAGGGDPDLFRS